MKKMTLDIHVDGRKLRSVDIPLEPEAVEDAPVNEGDNFPKVEGVVVSNHGELWGALSLAEPGDTIWLKSGIYYGPIQVDTDRVTVSALPGHKPVFSALTTLSGDAWKKDGSVWRLPFSGIDKLPKHPASAAGKSRQYHRDKMSPYQLVYENGSDQVVQNEVFSRDTISQGAFWVEGGYGNEKAIYWRPSSGVTTPQHLKIARFPHLLTGTGKNVTIRGIHFMYGANSAKYGTINLVEGEAWTIEDCLVEFANAVGIEFRGRGHRFVRTIAQHCGQIGWHGYMAPDCTFIDCENNYNNLAWFDGRWEAGMKIDHGCHNNQFFNWKSRGNNAPGWWCDLNNNNLLVDGFTSDLDMGSAMQVEAGCKNSVFKRVEIRTVRPWLFRHANGSVDKSRMPLAAGLIVQAGVTGCLFEDYSIDGIAKQADGFDQILHAGIWYKKQESTTNRAHSGNNTWRSIYIDGVYRRWFIEGKAEMMPDRYDGHIDRD